MRSVGLGRPKTGFPKKDTQLLVSTSHGWPFRVFRVRYPAHDRLRLLFLATTDPLVCTEADPGKNCLGIFEEVVRGCIQTPDT